MVAIQALINIPINEAPLRFVAAHANKREREREREREEGDSKI